jgi:lactoylglutathione lyase
VVRSFHVRLIVVDFERCFRFYRDVLGLRVTWGEEADGSANGYAGFETPEGLREEEKRFERPSS